ncbi:MAG: heavy metal-associated domain protein [Sedimentibacter sp.]|jgi:sulfite exporter TauE/SafE/plastocyanin domain-containing protein/copper chaperone CopZ|nr:heavy metal-associated domain protein [Sedimentibacter sp.]
MNIKKEKIKVYDMTCTSCEARVEKAVLNTDGVITVKASFSGQNAEVEFDSEVCNKDKINEAINKAGYSTAKPKDNKIFGMLIIVAAIILLGINTSGFDMESMLSNASYAVLFIAGLLTSIHCVGMCGGIMLSQTVGNESKNKFEAMKPSLLYNAGRVISYTILGGIIGAVGSVFSLSFKSKAAVQIIAGLFMIIMGLNMSGFSLFRKLQIKMPKSFCSLKSKAGSPFVVGLLNGFMPCGPLQTMQIFALGTGSPVKGALSMLVFSLGTVPLMLTFGALSGLLSKGYTKKILKLSGVMIIVLGLIMGNRGLSILGINLNPLTAMALSKTDEISSNENVAKAVMQDGVQVINMTVSNRGFTPNAFYVQKGIPVKMIIDGKEINTCNNAIIIPSLNKEIKINKGENILEFSPDDKDMNFSCWMGMINGVIKVVDELESVDTSVPDPTIPAPTTGPSCCASPIDEDTPSNGQSIYGDDISKVPTEFLIGKAAENKIRIKGLGFELQPLVSVVSNSETTKITFDFAYFDNKEGEFAIVDGNTGEAIAVFDQDTAKEGVEFKSGESEVYGIVKDGALLGVITTVDDVTNADLESIRENLIAK